MPAAARATGCSRKTSPGWGGPGGRVITTFRPDDVADMEFPGWARNVARLGEITGEDTATYDGYLAALRSRREAFIAAGATSSDHGHPSALTLDLSRDEAAVRLSLSSKMLMRLAARGEGPTVIRVGRRTLYSEEAVTAWIAEQTGKAQRLARPADAAA